MKTIRLQVSSMKFAAHLWKQLQDTHLFLFEEEDKRILEQPMVPVIFNLKLDDIGKITHYAQLAWLTSELADGRGWAFVGPTCPDKQQHRPSLSGHRQMVEMPSKFGIDDWACMSNGCSGRIPRDDSDVITLREFNMMIHAMNSRLASKAVMQQPRPSAVEDAWKTQTFTSEEIEAARKDRLAEFPLVKKAKEGGLISYTQLQEKYNELTEASRLVLKQHKEMTLELAELKKNPLSAKIGLQEGLIEAANKVFMFFAALPMQDHHLVDQRKAKELLNALGDCLISAGVGRA